jgi:mannosylglycerate hydrolase
VRTIDEVLAVLEEDADFPCFTLDGQAVVLEDYLEVRRGQEERLRALVQAGRLAIGPWYTLPDEYLAGPESLVRNLLEGRHVCERFGRPMTLGYLPDTFGHVAQLPQLLCGFGLDTFAFWRGLGDEAAELGPVFRWRGPNGSEVVALRLLGGYANADRLDPERALRVLERHGQVYERAGIAEVLLMNGDDHRPIQRGLRDAVRECERRIPGSRFRIATIEAYVEAVRAHAGAAPRVEGELCGGHDIAVLRGVNSTRVPLKQANEAVERALLRAEALAALAHLRGARCPGAELPLAWRELLRNHAHDSICGCSIDEVERDMHARFERARRVAEAVEAGSLAALAGAQPPWRRSPSPTERRAVVNLLPWRRRRLVELDLPPALARARALVAETEDELLPVQRAGSRALVALEAPGLGARALRLRRGTTRRGGARSPSPRAIENERYRVEVSRNGTLLVADRATGRTATGLHLLEDAADRGDEYSFCPLEGDVPWTSDDADASVRVAMSGPVAAELEIELRPRLPRGLRRDRRARARALVACRVRTRVRLVSGVARVELQTTVDNRARDHRLRVRFPAPAAEGDVRVEGHFAVLRRPARPVARRRWAEPPQPTHHTLGMVAAGELALFTRGLCEYEAIPGRGGLELALTLLRCVGWLSRGDLSTRFHHAGPALETPGAQCLGRHVFEYALALDGNASDAELVRAAHDYRHDFALGPPGVDLEEVLSLGGAGFALSALKGAEDGDGVIARIYNPGSSPALVAVGGNVAIERCRLDETAPAPCDRELELAPFEVATLRLRRGGQARATTCPATSTASRWSFSSTGSAAPG